MNNCNLFRKILNLSEITIDWSNGVGSIGREYLSKENMDFIHDLFISKIIDCTGGNFELGERYYKLDSSFIRFDNNRYVNIDRIIEMIQMIDKRLYLTDKTYERLINVIDKVKDDEIRKSKLIKLESI